MRRIVDEEPPSRAARWTRRLGTAALLCVGATVALSRNGIMVPGTAVEMLRAGVGLAALAALAALVATVDIWRTGRIGVGAVVTGLLLAGAAAAGPLWFAWTMAGRPPIADLSTTPDDPLSFSAALARRHAPVPPLPSADIRAQQAAFYPDLHPIEVDLEAADAYAALGKIAKARRWQVLLSQPPRGSGPGLMEAVAHTPVMGFAQDVVLRVSAAGPGQCRARLGASISVKN